MELVPIVVLAVLAACVVVVCARRTMLGKRMESSLEVFEVEPSVSLSPRIEAIQRDSEDGIVAGQNG